MTLKISVAAAIALATILAVPDASYAASRKHHKGAAASTETGLTNPRECLGGGCTGQNPDRVGTQCSNDCYKRPRASRPKSSAQSPQ
jgi:hypothetical protein